MIVLLKYSSLTPLILTGASLQRWGKIKSGMKEQSDLKWGDLTLEISLGSGTSELGTTS